MPTPLHERTVTLLGSIAVAAQSLAAQLRDAPFHTDTLDGLLGMLQAQLDYTGELPELKKTLEQQDAD